jgi:hypothetical protein
MYMNVVANGASGDNFVVGYNRQLEDFTNLNFSAGKNKLFIVMTYD